MYLLMGDSEIFNFEIMKILECLGRKKIDFKNVQGVLTYA